MDYTQLYQFALLMILTGIVIGIGVVVLDNFAASSGLSSEAETAINASRDAVATIGTTWMSLIITVGVLAIILGLVIGGFAVYGSKGR